METIAHCYAVSLFSLAKDENAVDSYQKDMLLINEIFSKEPEFLTFFSHVLIDDEVKCNLIDQSFKGTVNIYIVNFLKLLIKKRRTSIGSLSASLPVRFVSGRNTQISSSAS